MKIRIDINVVSVAILFLLLLMPNIYAFFVAVDIQASLIARFGYLAIVLACLVLPTLFLNRRIYFIVEGIFSFLLMSIDIASLYLNKQSASKLFIHSILSTNYIEAKELLWSVWPLCILVVLLWMLYFYMAFRLDNRNFCWRKNYRFILSVVVFVFLLMLGSMYIISKKITPNRTESQILALTMKNFSLKFKKIYPFNIYILGNELVQENLNSKEYAKELENFSFGIEQRDNNDSTLVVLFIGDAARYDHFGINGYERNTTPYLSVMSNIVSFDSIYTQANLTAYSVPHILTRIPIERLDALYKEKSVLEAFSEAGYSTAFISNNLYDLFVRRIMDASDYDYFFSKGMDAINNYDIEFVDKLIQISKSESQFVILHSLGSHFRYDLRYPIEDEFYKPAFSNSFGYDQINEDNRQLLVNAYDNSIRYTDKVLYNLIFWADSLNREVVVMYLSDHGESFWDDERGLSLHGAYELSEAEYHIPLIIWYSDEYREKHNDKIENLRANKNKTQTTEVVFSTLLDMVGIEEVVDSTRSLCSSYLESRDSFYVLNGLGEIDNYVVR